jgi:hypothetical protein
MHFTFFASLVLLAAICTSSIIDRSIVGSNSSVHTLSKRKAEWNSSPNPREMEHSCKYGCVACTDPLLINFCEAMETLSNQKKLTSTVTEQLRSRFGLDDGTIGQMQRRQHKVPESAGKWNGTERYRNVFHKEYEKKWGKFNRKKWWKWDPVRNEDTEYIQTLVKELNHILRHFKMRGGHGQQGSEQALNERVMTHSYD